MADQVPPEDWFDREGRIDAAVVEAMKGAETWRAGCVAAARATGIPEDEVLEVYDWSSGSLDDTTIFRFATVHIAGSSWGLYVRKLAGTAFLLTDREEPYEEYVWAWWTPPDDRAALESAVEAAWLQQRWEMWLPPAASTIGAIWEGPKEEYALAFRCMDRLLAEDDEAWLEFKEQLPDAIEALGRLLTQGLRLHELGGNAPAPVHDFAWFERIVGSAELDTCRRDEAARRSLVSYYLKA